MVDSTTKKASGVFATVLIGLIVVSFMFSGAQSMKGTPDTLAKVGKYDITIGEYENAYNRMTNFFSMIYNGGKPLTRQQIDQLQIKNQALNQVVSDKLRLLLGDDIGISVGNYQVSQEVMNYEERDPDGKPVKIFYTNGQFDKIKYKNLLSNSSRFTPQKFEALIRDQAQLKATANLLNNVPVSDTYIDELVRFKSEAVKVDAVKIEPKHFNQFVPVSKKEIADYLKEEINANRVQAIFKDRKERLDQAEQVKARHILLSNDPKAIHKISMKELVQKVNANNFADMAKKYSEEPGADKSGGDLGWFGRGRMVPEFDKVAFSLTAGKVSGPITTQFGTHLILVEGKKAAKEAKFEDYRDSIALEQIRNGKTEEGAKLAQEITQKVEKAFKVKDSSAISSLAKEYKLSYVPNAELTKLERSAGDIALTGAQAKKVFAKPAGEVFTFTDSPIETIVVLSKGLAKKDIKREEEVNLLKKGLDGKFSQELLKELQENTKVKLYQEL